MSEERKTIYCTKCGNANDAAAKFCSSCGAKLEQPAQQQGSNLKAGGIFSGEGAAPSYERITDAEEEKPSSPYQEEIQIDYGSDTQGNGPGKTYTDNSYYSSSSSSYYSSGQDEEKQGGGYIGFAIASLICGIISLICCCLGLFSSMLAIAAIVLGVITLCFKYDGKGMAIAGIAIGGTSLVLIILVFILSNSAAYRAYRDLVGVTDYLKRMYERSFY